MVAQGANRALDTVGCFWTGEFFLKTLRVNGEIFESGKKQLRNTKYRIRVHGASLSSAPFETFYIALFANGYETLRVFF